MNVLLASMHFLVALSLLVMLTWMAAMLPRSREKPIILILYLSMVWWPFSDAATYMATSPEQLFWVRLSTAPLWIAFPNALLWYQLRSRYERLSGLTMVGLAGLLFLGLLVMGYALQQSIASHQALVDILMSDKRLPALSSASGLLLLYFAFFLFVLAFSFFHGLMISIPGGIKESLACHRPLGLGVVGIAILIILRFAGLQLGDWVSTIIMASLAWYCGYQMLRKAYLLPVASIRAEGVAALGQVEQRDKLLEALPIGLAVLDLSEQSISYANAPFRQALNLKADTQLSCPEALRKQVIGEGINVHQYFEKEIRFNLAEEGDERVFMLSAHPFEENEQAQLLLGLRDLTDLRQTEQSLQQQREQLFLKQKLEDLGRLSAGIAHDFNNQLSSIFACADFVKIKSKQDDEAYTAALDVLRLGKSTSAMIQQLLSLSRRRNNKAYQEVDIAALLGDMAALIKRIIGSQIELNLKLEQEHGLFCLFDPQHFEQVVLSLVNNAADAMPTGGQIGLILSTSGSELLLRVQDQGRGMDSKVQKRVFEPFFSTKGERNSGLGLAVSYSLVRAAGGELSIEKTDLTGTSMLMRLPLLTGTQVSSALRRMPTPAMLPASQARQAEMGQKRKEASFTNNNKQNPAGGIQSDQRPLGAKPMHESKPVALFVDDEAVLLRLGSHILSRKGYRVLKAESFAEASAILQTIDRLHIVVADLGLKDGSGWEVLKMARSKIPDVQVVLVSGDLQRDLPPWSSHLGAAPQTLQKPFEPEELIKICAV